MEHEQTRVTTGLTGLDEILDGLRLGDNVVWKVGSIADYRLFVKPFVDSALADGRRIVYLRFGKHDPILDTSLPIQIYTLDPRPGFESFATQIHAIIKDEGREIFYVFDCLSELLTAWATDHMIGNFFRVTCPYLYELDTVAYFALISGRHALRTIARIRETTQLLLELHRHEEQLYIQPLKVWERHSPTMFLPHRRERERFIPLANSYDATNLLTAVSDPASANRQLDHWHRMFLQAEEVASSSDATEKARVVEHLCYHLIGREKRILELARRFFSLDDLLKIKARVIGSGFLGGKAVGMLLARNILMRDESHDWQADLENHDSYFVGSNVYCSFLVHNDLWKLYMEQKTSDGYFDAAAELRERMLTGEFPDMIRDGFMEMLEYYGQYPIIVRSSSLLEDSFGSAFAGKYDSFFCPNQGSPEQRLEALEDAVRKIFASTMSVDALTYRIQRGLDRQDEQMGLLVQRVSGAYRKHYYFPDLAGVGVSYNTFVWDKGMDPRAGMLRLVLGLGTRAVDRVEGDYPRIVALDDPMKLPLKCFEDIRRFSQKDLDLVNVSNNTLESRSLFQLLEEDIDLRMERYAVADIEAMDRLAERGKKMRLWLLTFEHLFKQTEFPKKMQRMLKTIEAAYDYPVDIEFTVNFAGDEQPKINIVQCRPLQTKGLQEKVQLPENLADEQVFFRSSGGFMGGNISLPIRRLIWVDPREYIRLQQADKYEVARLIGRLNHRIASRDKSPTLLLGPGRWGTSTPSLGVPVNFSEISNMTAIGEVAFPDGDLMPELSFGSHFFQDLVEADIFYLALFPRVFPCMLNSDWIYKSSNLLEELMPSSSRFKPVVKVIDTEVHQLRLSADVIQQQMVCHWLRIP